MAPDSTGYLQDFIQKHKSGQPLGIYSICSANKWVIRAAFEQALADDSRILIETTCNQVNQFGGYTGMTPAQFVEDLFQFAGKMGFPKDRIILGGDHLGPSVWQKEPSAEAMEKSLELVRLYVESGFSKIHLDASMPCADDPKPLPEEIIAKRSAELCAAAETVATGPAPLYIIGTEVPTPGGALESISSLDVTSPEEIRQTIESAHSAFVKHGLDQAWNRVIGIVAQPGVEFGSDSIVEYDPAKAKTLSRAIEEYDHLVYEAHSTDYQTRFSLKSLVEDHFCILKVGPALTFAFREAILSLALIENELLPFLRGIEASEVSDILENTMLAHPNDWQSHYIGPLERQSFERKFSLSDRVRYYWQTPAVKASLHKLISTLEQIEIPLSLLSQFFPIEYQKVRLGQLSPRPSSLILSRIRSVIKDYSYACGHQSF